MAEAESSFSHPEGLLEVNLTLPRPAGYNPAWPEFCVMYVFVGGNEVEARVLPFEDGTEKRDMLRLGKVEDELKRWRLSFSIPVASQWADLSIDLIVERIDSKRRRRSFVVTRGGPHTSRYTAVIARAQVQLLDALVIGDLDEEEVEDKKKRFRNAVEERRLEGTLPFGKTVPLLDWELPAPRDADGEPRSVLRGTVDLCMSLKRLA